MWTDTNPSGASRRTFRKERSKAIGAGTVVTGVVLLLTIGVGIRHDDPLR